MSPFAHTSIGMPLFLADQRMARLGPITSGPGFALGIILEILLIGSGMAFTIVYRRRKRINWREHRCFVNKCMSTDE